RVETWALARARAALAAGQPAMFGNVGLSRRGLLLHGGREAVPWCEVRGLRIRDGAVVALYRAQWHRLGTVAGVPNARVLEALAGELLAAARAQAAPLPGMPTAF